MRISNVEKLKTIQNLLNKIQYLEFLRMNFKDKKCHITQKNEVGTVYFDILLKDENIGKKEIEFVTNFKLFFKLLNEAKEIELNEDKILFYCDNIIYKLKNIGLDVVEKEDKIDEKLKSFDKILEFKLEDKIKQLLIKNKKIIGNYYIHFYYEEINPNKLYLKLINEEENLNAETELTDIKLIKKSKTFESKYVFSLLESIIHSNTFYILNHKEHDIKVIYGKYNDESLEANYLIMPII